MSGAAALASQQRWVRPDDLDNYAFCRQCKNY